MLVVGMGTFGPPLGLYLTLLVTGVRLLVRRRSGFPATLAGLVVLHALVGLLVPAFSSARRVARHSMSMSNAKQIGLALHNYHDVNGEFPPPYTVDDAGRPLHSWRTLLLPYLEEATLYRRLDLRLAWDHPRNLAYLKAATSAAQVFSSPSVDRSGRAVQDAHYFAVVGDTTFWPSAGGVSFRSIEAPPDSRTGTDRTIAFIESAHPGVRWYEPADLSMDQAISLLSGRAHEDFVWLESGFLWSTRMRSDGLFPRVVGFVDGAVRGIGTLQSSETARGLLTIKGRTALGDWESEISYDDQAVTIGYVVHWWRLLGVVVFACLAFAPLLPSRHGTAPSSGAA
ncbi:MAG: DUF1559 domain-containing protein [Planctomycetota bacterium]